MPKIAMLPGRATSVEAVIASIQETEGVDGVVCAVRVNGAWQTTWGGADLTIASISLATIKLLSDVQATVNDSDEPNSFRST